DAGTPPRTRVEAAPGTSNQARLRAAGGTLDGRVVAAGGNGRRIGVRVGGHGPGGSDLQLRKDECQRHHLGGSNETCTGRDAGDGTVKVEDRACTAASGRRADRRSW